MIRTLTIIFLSLIGIFLLFLFSVTWFLRGQTTTFEDCFPPVSLVSTKETSNIHIFRRFSSNNSFKLGRGDYGVCIGNSTRCSSTWGSSRDFTTLPIGSKIILDGFIAEHSIPFGEGGIYFRGKIDVDFKEELSPLLRQKIDSKSVWLSSWHISSFTDPANQDSLKLMGRSEEGLFISSLECFE